MEAILKQQQGAEPGGAKEAADAVVMEEGKGVGNGERG